MCDTRRLTSRGPGWKGLEGLDRPIRRIRGNHHGKSKDADEANAQKRRVADRLRREMMEELIEHFAEQSPKDDMAITGPLSCLLQDGLLVLRGRSSHEVLHN